MRCTYCFALLGLAARQVWVSCSETLDSPDSCSLLQLDSHLKRGLHVAKRVGEKDISRNSSQCLKFMHIPKTGGTSIDSAGMHQPSPVFDSLMQETYKRIAGHMSSEDFESKYGSSLGRMYDGSHKSMDFYKWKWMPFHFLDYHWVLQKDGGICEDLHTPPSDNPAVLNFFDKRHCTVFCSVREPLQRFISAYEMMTVGKCDPAGFESKLRSFLPMLQKHPSYDACVFIPQVHYVLGAQNASSSKTQVCDHILHTEHLNDEFDAFMKKNGLTLTLPEKKLMGEKAYSGACRVDRNNVTQAAKDLVYEHYRADYEFLKYPRP